MLLLFERSSEEFEMFSHFAGAMFHPHDFTHPRHGHDRDVTVLITNRANCATVAHPRRAIRRESCFVVLQEPPK